MHKDEKKRIELKTIICLQKVDFPIFITFFFSYKNSEERRFIFIQLIQKVYFPFTNVFYFSSDTVFCPNFLTDFNMKKFQVIFHSKKFQSRHNSMSQHKNSFLDRHK